MVHDIEAADSLASVFDESETCESAFNRPRVIILLPLSTSPPEVYTELNATTKIKKHPPVHGLVSLRLLDLLVIVVKSKVLHGLEVPRPTPPIHPYKLVHGPESLVREVEDAVHVLRNAGLAVALRDHRDSAAEEVAQDHLGHRPVERSGDGSYLFLLVTFVCQREVEGNSARMEGKTYRLILERSWALPAGQRGDGNAPKWPEGRDVDPVLLAKPDEALLWPVRVAFYLIHGRLDPRYGEEFQDFGSGKVRYA
jgi:hypothetical protein